MLPSYPCTHLFFSQSNTQHLCSESGNTQRQETGQNQNCGNSWDRGNRQQGVPVCETYPHQKCAFKMKKAALNHFFCREDSKLTKWNLWFGYNLLFDLRSSKAFFSKEKTVGTGITHTQVILHQHFLLHEEGIIGTSCTCFFSGCTARTCI